MTGQSGDVLEILFSPGGQLHSDQVVAVDEVERLLADLCEDSALAHLHSRSRTLQLGGIGPHVEATGLRGEAKVGAVAQMRGIGRIDVEQGRVHTLQPGPQLLESACETFESYARPNARA